MRRWMFVALLAGCSSSGPKYSPPPPEAVASCALDRRFGSAHARTELWFDDKGRTIQVDGFDGSTVFEYDDSDRVVRATTGGSVVTWTYEPTRVTSIANGLTDIYDVGSDGRVTRFEGPEEFEASQRNVTDFQYDPAGRITSETGQVRFSNSPGGPVMLQQFQFTFSYDDQGRLASASSGPVRGVTTYTYSETPGHLTIALDSEFPATYTYDFDTAGRIVHAGFDTSVHHADFTYSYVDDRITAVADDGHEEVDSSGVCPGLTTTLAPSDPLPIRPDGYGVTLPNPPVDDFDEIDY